MARLSLQHLRGNGYPILSPANQHVLVGAAIRSFLAYLVASGEVATEFRDHGLYWRAESIS